MDGCDCCSSGCCTTLACTTCPAITSHTLRITAPAMERTEKTVKRGGKNGNHQNSAPTLPPPPPRSTGNYLPEIKTVIRAFINLFTNIPCAPFRSRDPTVNPHTVENPADGRSVQSVCEMESLQTITVFTGWKSNLKWPLVCFYPNETWSISKSISRWRKTPAGVKYTDGCKFWIRTTSKSKENWTGYWYWLSN